MEAARWTACELRGGERRNDEDEGEDTRENDDKKPHSIGDKETQ
jgi:hypothetical protein